MVVRRRTTPNTDGFRRVGGSGAIIAVVAGMNPRAALVILPLLIACGPSPESAPTKAVTGGGMNVPRQSDGAPSAPTAAEDPADAPTPTPTPAGPTTGEPAEPAPRPSGPAPTRGPDASACRPSADLDAFIEAAMAERGIPGLPAAILTEGGLAWANGYGFADIDARRPVTPDTIFALMSMSKVVTAAGVMQVVEDGRLDLDADINTYLPDFDITHPFHPGVAITTRMLLSHASGIAGDDYGVLQQHIRTDDDVMPLSQMVEELLVRGGARYEDAYHWSDAAPGTRFTYSSIGISLAALVVESITGAPFADTTDESIFGVLEMNDTSWRLAPFASRVDDMALMYNPLDESGERFEAVDHFTFAEYPAGSIRSSVRDFAKFVGAMIGDGLLGDRRILEPATVAEMQDTPFEDASGSQAIGWTYSFNQRVLIGHGGDDTGASTDFVIDVDSKKGVILLMNVTRRADTNAILDALLDASDACN